LRHCAGTQFDPTVVQAFVEILGGELAAPEETPQQLGSWPPEDIVAELSQGRDPGQLWAAAGFTLCRLLDVPDCDLYQIDDDGGLVCVASVCEGAWNPEDLGKRADHGRSSSPRPMTRGSATRNVPNSCAGTNAPRPSCP
jgi:hypothetical protein